MVTRGSYVNNYMVKFGGGHPENVSFMQFSQNIDGFRQNNSQGFSELIQLYTQNPFRKFSCSLFTKTIHWL